MVESGHPKGDVRLVRAMRRAGLPQEDQDRVTTALVEKPTDLITVQEAADKSGRSHNTIMTWIKKERLTEYGRERFPARGGGKILVSEAELWELLANPPKMGRPPKNGRN